MAAFEALIGHTVPEDYRNFLTLSGGGWCRSAVTSGGDQDTCRYILHMYGLSAVGAYSLEASFRKPEWYPVPNHLLVVGSDSGGNPIALCLRDDRFGEVSVMDHEIFAFEGEAEKIEDAEEYGLV